jgi:NAD(P)-dependent dehydrogenase (short-subunit alcohol dehydrogenase family)
MAASKTIALFGAGPGLGTALATRSGREGHRVALIARRAAPLDPNVIAEEIWSLVTERDRVVSNLPAMPANNQGGAQ